MIAVSSIHGVSWSFPPENTDPYYYCHPLPSWQIVILSFRRSRKVENKTIPRTVLGHWKNHGTPFFHKQGKALACNIHFAIKLVSLSRARVLERQSMPRGTRDWQSTKWDWQTQPQQRYRKWRRQWIVSSPSVGTARHGSIATKKSFDKLPLLRRCCCWCCYWYGFPSWHKSGVTTPKHSWMILGCSTMSFQYQETDMAVLLTSVPSLEPM